MDAFVFFFAMFFHHLFEHQIKETNSTTFTYFKWRFPQADEYLFRSNSSFKTSTLLKALTKLMTKHCSGLTSFMMYESRNNEVWSWHDIISEYKSLCFLNYNIWQAIHFHKWKRICSSCIRSVADLVYGIDICRVLVIYSEFIFFKLS